MRIFVLIAAIHLAGCAAAQPIIANGQISQDQSGGQKFTFVIHPNSYAGLVPLGELEQQRLQALSGWLGSRDACKGGYSITSRTENADAIIYEGRCK